MAMRNALVLMYTLVVVAFVFGADRSAGEKKTENGFFAGAVLQDGEAVLDDPIPKPKPGPKPLYSSPVVTKKTPGHAVDIAVDLGDAKKVFLVAGDGGNGLAATGRTG